MLCKNINICINHDIYVLLEDQGLPEEVFLKKKILS